MSELVSPWWTVPIGAAIYLGLCLYAWVAGRGLLIACGLEQRVSIVSGEACDLRGALFMGPPLLLTFWTVGIGLLIGSGCFSMSVVSPLMWALSTPFLVIGGRRCLADRPPLPWLPLLIGCVGAPAVLMVRYFYHGLTEYHGSLAPDIWTYMAYGEYIKAHPRGAEGGLAPLYQFATHLNQARFISRCFVAHFSWLTPQRDTQSVACIYQAWTLFVVASSVAWCWLRAGWLRRWVGLAVFLTVVSGWVANLNWANNLDNGIALVYMPALAGCFVALRPRDWRLWLVVGALVAAALYSYQEMAPVTLAGASLFALQRLVETRREWRAWIRGLLCSVGLFLLLFLPVGYPLLIFGWTQHGYVQAHGGMRPGEGFFAGLHEARYRASAIWGLGGEHRLGGVLAQSFRTGVAWLLTVTAVAGAVELGRRRRWDVLLALGLCLAGAAYWLFAKHYSYGTYKLLLSAWWLSAGLLVAAAMGITRMRRVAWRWGLLAAWLGVAGAAVSQAFHGSVATMSTRYMRSAYQHERAPAFRAARTLAERAAGEPILIAVDDWFAHQWAVYYLREVPIQIVSYRMYMAQSHVVPFMERAPQYAQDQIRFVLTESRVEPGHMGPGWRLVAEKGAFRLWEICGREWVLMQGVQTPNGLETYEGEPLFWMGGGTSVVRFLAGCDARVTLSLQGWVGGSRPEGAPTRIRIDDGVSEPFEQLMGDGVNQIHLKVRAGVGELRLTPLDPALPSRWGVGDARPLIFAVLKLRVERMEFEAENGSSNQQEQP